MLIATGVLMNIPGDILEAARIDGANPVQTFFSIKLPYLLGVQGPAPTKADRTVPPNGPCQTEGLLQRNISAAALSV